MRKASPLTDALGPLAMLMESGLLSVPVRVGGRRSSITNGVASLPAELLLAPQKIPMARPWAMALPSSRQSTNACPVGAPRTTSGGAMAFQR